MYHEGVLSWVGGAQKITGKPCEPGIIEKRKKLMKQALSQVFLGRKSFEAVWTYLSLSLL